MIDDRQESLSPARLNRDREIVDTVRAFLQATLLFRALDGKYGNRKLRFNDLKLLIDDKGESALFRLKGLTHKLFRMEEGLEGDVSKGVLFDLAVSSLFHTAMKAREEQYQVEYYGPKIIARIKRFDADVVPSPHERALWLLFEEIMDEGKKDLKREMKEMRKLFAGTAEHLKSLLKEFSGNALLVRYLLEEQGLVCAVYGEGAIDELFELMFPGGQREALLRAGRSYMTSAHYEEAATYFRKAKECVPKRHEPVYFYHCALGLGAYYLNDYAKVLAHLTEAARHARGVKNKDRVGTEKMYAVLAEVEGECRRRGDVAGATEAKALLRRMTPRKRKKRT